MQLIRAGNQATTWKPPVNSNFINMKRNVKLGLSGLNAQALAAKTLVTEGSMTWNVTGMISVGFFCYWGWEGKG